MFGFTNKENVARSTVFLSAEKIFKVDEKIIPRNVSPFFFFIKTVLEKISRRPRNHFVFLTRKLLQSRR